MRNDRLRAILVITFIAVFAICGIIHSIYVDKALKNSTLVEATILEVLPARSATNLLVEYVYNHQRYTGKVQITEGDFKRREHVIISVANEHPEDYIVFVRKIK